MEYPFFDSIDFSCQDDYMKLIMWLEDRKIQKLGTFQRKYLRQYSGSWDSSFSDYLKELDCPFTWSTGSMDCIAWLVSYAVSVEFEDICESSSSESLTNLHADGMLVDDDVIPIESTAVCNLDSIGSLLGLSRQECERDPGDAKWLDLNLPQTFWEFAYLNFYYFDRIFATCKQNCQLDFDSRMHGCFDD